MTLEYDTVKATFTHTHPITLTPINICLKLPRTKKRGPGLTINDNDVIVILTLQDKINCKNEELKRREKKCMLWFRFF